MDLFKLDPRGAYSPLEPFFYSRVPKAANTSITQTLFEHTAFRPKSTRREHPKYQFLRPLFLSRQEVGRLEHEAFKFTFVRDPYSRVLSAYLDKVGRQRHQGRRFLLWAQRHNQPETFLGFCRYLEAGGLFLDMHWAPQVAILCLPLERFDFIGRVEHLNRDLAVVLERLFRVQAAGPAPHAGTHTRASQQVDDAYGPEERAIVNRLYASDFERLGYDRHL
ncbi:MAG: sulfotransferase family protein [Synechococcaceae cyanobacterium]|nr:sulfotransferase family protein [Synechococcaceae cyanobacterium]